MPTIFAFQRARGSKAFYKRRPHSGEFNAWLFCKYYNDYISDLLV